MIEEAEERSSSTGSPIEPHAPRLQATEAPQAVASMPLHSSAANSTEGGENDGGTGTGLGTGRPTERRPVPGGPPIRRPDSGRVQQQRLLRMRRMRARANGQRPLPRMSYAHIRYVRICTLTYTIILLLYQMAC